MLNVRLAGYRDAAREVAVAARSKERAIAEPVIIRLEKQ
jgi:hypothetical protein